MFIADYYFFNMPGIPHEGVKIIKKSCQTQTKERQRLSANMTFNIFLLKKRYLKMLPVWWVFGTTFEIQSLCVIVL